MIRVERASVGFGGVRALDDVSVECADGRIVGIVGPSGSGKSTLLDAMCGRVELAAGAIVVNGSKIDGMRPHLVARLGLARTYEADHLFGRMTAFENVLAGTFLRDALEPVRAAGAAAIIASLSLADSSTKHVWELDAGERRRVALARALATDAKALLIEEPFMALDAAARDAVAAALRNAAKDRAASVVIAARDVEACEGLCDDVLVLHAGKRVAQGAFDAVVRDVDVRDAYLGVEWRQ